MRFSSSAVRWIMPIALPRISHAPRQAALVAVAVLLLAWPARAEPVQTAPDQAMPGQTTIEVIGDSQAQGLAGALRRLFLRNTRYRVLDRSKIASGIALRPSFDWPSTARALAAEHRVDLAVMMFGANDRPPIRRAGRVDPALREEYRRGYDKRVREIIRAFRDARIEVIWVGHPVVRDNVYTEDMAFLNQIFQTAAADEGAHWVATWDLFTTLDGGYTAYGKGVDGMTQRMRADDGVHFTAAGYDLVASRIEPWLMARRGMVALSPPSDR